MSVENCNTTKLAAAQIVAAFAGREAATVAEILDLAQRLPQVLEGLDGYDNQQRPHYPPAPKAKSPAVAISKSFSDDKVTCLCCGKEFTMLKRHLKAEHGLTEAEYRTEFGLPAEHPLVAPNYSVRKAEYAKRIGLGKYTRDESLVEGLLGHR